MTDGTRSLDPHDSDEAIRAMIHRAADAVDVVGEPKSSAVADTPHRRRRSTGRSWLVGAVVAAAAALFLVAYVGGRASTTAVVVDQPADSGPTSQQPSTRDPDGSRESDPVEGTEGDPQKRNAALAAALAETEIPRVTLTAETADYSDPWKPPTVRFELPEDWQGNREFTEGGPVGNSSFFRLWAVDAAHDMGRFVVVGGGPVTPPAGSESIQAQDGTTWEVSALDVGVEVVVAVSQPTDGRGVIVFGGFSRDEWQHALRTAPTAYGAMQPGELPPDVIRVTWGGPGQSPTMPGLGNSNERGPWNWLVTTAYTDRGPRWAELLGDRVNERLVGEVLPPGLGRIGELTRCEWQGDVNVCAAVEWRTDYVNADPSALAELSAWRDGLRMDATVTIAGDGESVTAQGVQDAFDLLGASIVAARIPVP